MQKREFAFTLSDGTSAQAYETDTIDQFVLDLTSPDGNTDTFTWTKPAEDSGNELEVDSARLEAIAELSHKL